MEGSDDDTAANQAPRPRRVRPSAAPHSRFGAELDRVLDARAVTTSAAARTLGTSAAYLSSVRNGTKKISPTRIDQLASAFALDPDEAARLHRAAARDAGFRLDLPDDFDD